MRRLTRQLQLLTPTYSVVHLRIEHLVPLRFDEESDSVNSSGQGTAPDQESDEQDVGIRGREEYDLPGGLDGFPVAEVDDDPGEKQEAEELPADAAKVLDAFRHLQNSVTATKTLRLIRRTLTHRKIRRFEKE